MFESCLERIMEWEKIHVYMSIVYQDNNKLVTNVSTMMYTLVYNKLFKIENNCKHSYKIFYFLL